MAEENNDVKNIINSKFREIFDGSSDGIVVFDKNGYVEYVNKAFPKVAGIPSKEITGKHSIALVKKFLTKKDVPRVMKKLRDRLLGREISEFELKVNEKVLRVGSPIKGMGHFGFIAALRDVTSRKEAEEKLEKSEEKYRSLVETAEEIIATVGTKGEFIFVNDSVKRILGYKPKELIGVNCFKFLHPEDIEKVSKKFEQVKKGKKSIVEYRYRRKDNTYAYLSTTASLIKNPEKHVIVVTRDITDQKKTEETLRESEEQFRVVFENMNDAVFWADIKGNIIKCNKAAEELLEMPSNMIIGMHQTEMHAVDKRKYYAKVFKDYIKTGKRNNIPGEIITRTGKIIPVEISATVVKIKGKPIIQGVFKNVKDRRESEEKIRQVAMKYQTLFDSSRDAIMTLAPPSWKFTSGNKSTIDIFGCRDEKHFTSLAPWHLSPKKQPDSMPSRDKAKEMIMKAMQEGSNFFNWQHMTVKGKEFPATVLLTKVELERGKPFLQATVRDVKKQKEIEESLKKRATELERFNGFAIDRELKMIELKKEIKILKDKLSEK